MAARLCLSRRKPYHGTNNYDSIFYTTGAVANLRLKFRNFRYNGKGGRLTKVRLTPLNWPIRMHASILDVSPAQAQL